MPVKSKWKSIKRMYIFHFFKDFGKVEKTKQWEASFFFNNSQQPISIRVANAQGGESEKSDFGDTLKMMF